jgi:hypothetical protein
MKQKLEAQGSISANKWREREIYDYLAFELISGRRVAELKRDNVLCLEQRNGLCLI